MKKIDSIIIHCSATRAGQDIKAKDIDRMHRARGFSQIGYNYVIDLDGTIEAGRPLTIAGAHCIGYNDHSVGICYIGGLDTSGKPADTRTPAAELLGHRDTSRDLNDNGIVEPFEWIKLCPCFDVREEYKSFLKPIIVQS
ncbi:MAG: N-acetylmuramoyl-L-alanine amidase [Parabacteroides merdae]|nr:N-acetylmuramoyl-L-alanine amidase [Parabacteroides merdae]